MTNNEALIGLRYLMNITDARLVEIAALGETVITLDEIRSFLMNDQEAGYTPLSHEVMAGFLNGLIVYKRGRDPASPLPPLDVPVTNNVVLKKMRVAFELKDVDIIEIIAKSGLRVSKSELSAFFRKRDHRNYRECGDQFLRNLFKGMSL
ncbi:MAG: DUF1456 family protein [Cryobacterium sp.]|nr:DUF1456 family protein [Oligoflexia bacterium]